MASSLTNVLVEKTPVKNDQGQTVMQTVSYTYGLGPVAQSGGGITEYLLADGLGSVRQYTSGTGDVLRSQTFDPYGNRYEWRQSDAHWAIASPFGWTGEQSDPNGLTYLRARYYAPSMGRFTQLDPFAGALALPSSLNGYAYGHGNPTRYTDPEGLCGPLCWFAIIAVGATVLGGAAYAYEVHSNIQQGMDPWQAMYYNNINWRFVGAAAAVGAVIAPVAYLGYLCVMSGGWCVAAWEIVDYYDDMATMAAAAQGDPEAVGQMGIMAQLQLWPDLPVNFLFSKADNVAKYADEIGGAAKYADDVNWSGASDAFDVRPATGRFPDGVSVRSGGSMFRDSLRTGRRWYTEFGDIELLENRGIMNHAEEMSRLNRQLRVRGYDGLQDIPRGRPGTLEFDEMIEEFGGDRLKWVVTEDWKLRVIPGEIDGAEIYHSVMVGGEDVRAAGQVWIAGSPGNYRVTQITRHSGHYRSEGVWRYLDIGVAAFRHYGVIVPDDKIFYHVGAE